jgi:type II secretory pathway pseudopilin PulG
MRRTFANLVRLLVVLAIVCVLAAVASAPMAGATPFTATACPSGTRQYIMSLGQV